MLVNFCKSWIYLLCVLCGNLPLAALVTKPSKRLLKAVVVSKWEPEDGVSKAAPEATEAVWLVCMFAQPTCHDFLHCLLPHHYLLMEDKNASNLLWDGSPRSRGLRGALCIPLNSLAKGGWTWWLKWRTDGKTNVNANKNKILETFAVYNG